MDMSSEKNMGMDLNINIHVTINSIQNNDSTVIFTITTNSTIIAVSEYTAMNVASRATVETLNIH